MSMEASKSGKGWKRVLVTAAAGVAGLVELVLYQTGVFSGGKVGPGRTALPRTALPRGRTVVVEEHEVPVVYSSVGTLHSRDEVDVSSRILARITEVKVRNGDRVRRGALLARLDDTDLAAAVAQARKQVDEAEANIAGANELMKAAMAARDLALVEQERMRLLLAGGAISKQQYDHAESAARQAVASWNGAVQEGRAATARAAAGGENLKQAQAALAYTMLVSPMDGVVSERLADPGDLASPGGIIMRLFDPTRLRLEAPIRESLIKAVKVGDKVRFDVPAVGKSAVGEVQEIVPVVDPGSRTFMVMVGVGEDAGLAPGMFGTFHLHLGTERVVLVPQEAIARVGQVEYATVPADGGVHRVPVRTVGGPDGMRKVISGLTAGMEVFVRE